MLRKKAELGAPHFSSLTQDIVAGPQEAKCALKYVILRSAPFCHDLNY